MTRVAELYGRSTLKKVKWGPIVMSERCPFLARKCLKNRKSDSALTIGTCSMLYGQAQQPVAICPVRLLERNQIFTDCIHLLSLHEPGNELRVISEIWVPGGSVDYFLVSTRDGKVKDFVGIELQTLDTTGTVWPERQRFLLDQGIPVKSRDARSQKAFGMNWKMTAKTTLMQLNHKVETFEHLGKRLVLVFQDVLLDYMRKEFSFAQVSGQRAGDAMQFHSYELRASMADYQLNLKERCSTDAAGIKALLGLQASARIEMNIIIKQLEAKLPNSRLLTIGG